MADEGTVHGQAGSPPDPPRIGSLEATIDEKGRLRIPAQYVKYINSLGDTSVFVTCVGQDTARVFPLSVWKRNEALFEGTRGDKEFAAAAARLTTLASYTGIESEMDANGRVALSQKLRDAMGMQPKSSAHITFHNGAFNLETDAVMQRRLSAALAGPDENAQSVLDSHGVR